MEFKWYNTKKKICTTKTINPKHIGVINFLIAQENLTPDKNGIYSLTSEQIDMLINFNWNQI